MCIATAALATGIAGSAIGAGGSILGGIASGNSAAYQAQVARNNAIIAGQNATFAVAAGEQQASNTSMKGGAQIGTIKANQGASGVDVNTGSNVNVVNSQREVNRLNTATVMSNAERQAYGYRVAAVSDTAQAQLDQQTAEQAPIAGGLAAGGQLLSGASGLAFKWSQLNPGVIGGS
jgi:hypothetical protein